MPMATSQMKKPETKTGTWSSIFHSTEQLNEQQSALFSKKLLAVAISSVTYLRAVFPERCFGDRCLEDLNLKILRDEDAYPGSSQVIQWVRGCFDAIDRKYLRKIILGFYLNASDPDTVIETYTFKFDYYSDGINIYRNEQQIASEKTTDDTKRATIRLLRTLVLLTQTLKSLPDDVMMTMKILYYDDVTPPDYQPPGFEEIEYLGQNFGEDVYRIHVGDITTPFHMVGLRVQSKLQSKYQCSDGTQRNAEDHVDRKDINKDESYLDDEDKHNEKEDIKESSGDSENPYVVPEPENSDVSTLPDLRSRNRGTGNAKETAKEKVVPMECSTVPARSPHIPGPKDVANSANTRLSTPPTPADEQMVPNSDDANVECSCGFNEDDGMMILCDACKNWQHASCYRFFTEEDCPALHVCISCAKKENKKCTDSTLVELNPISLQTTCLWRRALVACRKTARLTASKFAERLGVELTVAQGLMKRMQNEGFLRQAAKGKRLGKIVAKEKLTIDALKKYFHLADGGTSSAGEPNDCKKSENNNKQPFSEKELQKMVSKAAEIDISGKYRESPKINKTEDVFDQRSKLRSRKRVISAVDNDLEFSVSDSQDPLDHYDKNPTKKKKASAAAQAIVI